MFSEISMPALLGHIITLLHNPNNISSEPSTVGTEIEKDAIHFLVNFSVINRESDILLPVAPLPISNFCSELES